MSRRRSIPIVWRDAIGDSTLDSTAKLVAYQLTRWMNGRGSCYPSREEIAAKAGLSVRAVDRAIRRLEAQGWLIVERSRGRRSHRYGAALAPTANEIRRWEWPNGDSDAPNGDSDAPNRVRRTGEVVEDDESAAPIAAAALSGSAASGPEEEKFAPEDDCHGCGKRRVIVGPDYRYCGECQAAVEAIRADAAT